MTPPVPPARELESALAAARVENERLRVALEHTFDYLDSINAKLPPEDWDQLRRARIHIRAALSPPAAPGPATTQGGD